MAVFIGRSGHRLRLLGPLGDTPRQRHAPGRTDRTGNMNQIESTWQALETYGDFYDFLLFNEKNRLRLSWRV